MAKRGRKPLPYNPVSWRSITNEVHELEAENGQFIGACRVVGERRGIDWQVVRLRCLDAKKHAESVRRAARRWRGER
jgi:hypothetical protein